MIPEGTKATIDRYVKYGCSPGGFVNAVLENNLMEAIGRADSENLQYLVDICSYVYNGIPSICWGNKNKVAEWKTKMMEAANRRFDIHECESIDTELVA